MVSLDDYRKKANENHLCAEYAGKWDGCKSNKQLMDLAVSAKGADYLCDTIAKGWGISPDYLCERFINFINGNYISKQNGYTSKLYCRFTGRINADTTLLVLIDSDANVILPKNSICEIYCTGKCNIEILGAGRAVFVCYGNPNDIKIIDKEGKTKRINKKERDSHD